MITYFSILIKTKRTFKYLIENDEGNYRLRTDLIFILSGLVTGVIVFFDRDWSMNGIIAKLFPFVFIVIIRFILYKFVFSFLILWISKNLKGNTNIDQVRFVLAYSLIPTILILPLIILDGIFTLYQVDNLILNWILFVIQNLMVLYVFIIMLIGIELLNDFGYKKAFISISPVLLLSIIMIVSAFA